ncbi:HipA family kinase [Gemmata sp.]|uniref:HipA family kinase n=1 Tax=Gemmata sp. TaxID=1914242 RepID=UPI003F70FDE7
MPPGPPQWNPTRVKGHKRSLGTYSLPLVVDTDAGEGYLKVLSDKTSPHDLASEYIGTQLAHLLGLPTLDYAVIDLPAAAPIELAGGACHQAGPAFITRAMDGMPWPGTAADLKALVNPGDLGRLVAFDTWTLNCDRFRPALEGRGRRRNTSNVFLSREGVSGDQFRLVAMDHGCCFKCQGDLTPHTIRSATGDRTLYGLFEEFHGRAQRRDALLLADAVQLITRPQIHAIVAGTPRPWLDCDAARTALEDLLVDRARILRSIIDSNLPPADLFDIRPPGGPGT